jgi:hypothetical protein
MRWSAVSSIAILLASSSAAVAQDPSVQVDSDSPAGTEYGLPVEQARSNGAPSAPSRGDDPPGAAAAAGTAATAGGTGAAAAARTLFGEGIAAQETKTRSKPSGRARERASGSASSGSTATIGGERAFAPTAQPSGSALPWLVGSALLVMVIGVALSRALRRVARPSQ